MVSRYDRSRAEAGFIGEYASGDTISHREHHCRTQETAGCCASGEGTVHDGLNGCRHLVCEIHKYTDRRNKVNHCHSRNDLRSGRCDRLQPAQGDGCDQKGQDESGPHRIETDRHFGDIDDGIHLSESTDTEVSDQYTKDGKERSQPFELGTHTILDVEHRAAGDLAFGVHFTIFHRQKTFGILGGHSEECGHPHPENSARAAGSDRCRDTYDIPCAYRSRKCCAERFEGVDIPVSLILCFEDQSQCLRQPEDLQELQTKRQEDARPYQQYQERRSPYKTIDRIQQFKIQIHFFVSLQESKINKKAGFSNKK